MEYEVKAGDIFRHFKGNRYEIVAVATDCEDGSLQVVYKALYPPYSIYVRSYLDFTEELDPQKYPNAKQKYRFQKEEDTGNRSTLGNLPQQEQAVRKKAEETLTFKGSEPSKKAETPKTREVEPQVRYVSDVTEPIGLEGKIDKNLLRFLSGRTYEEQITILKEMKGKITDEMYAIMFGSLDFPMPKGSSEELYGILLKRLETMSEFDGKRFRL